MWNINVTKTLKIFEIKKSVREKLLEDYETNEEEVSENVTKIRKWVETQKNLPLEAQDEIFIETVLLKTKFDVQDAKDRIKSYFKTVKKYPKIFNNLGHFKLSQEVCTSVILTNLTPSNERVNILKVNVNTNSSYDVIRGFNVAVTMATIFYHYDRIDKYRFILDFGDFKFCHFIKFTPWLLINLCNIHEKMVKVRVAGIEIINAPWFWNLIFSLAKSVFKPTLMAKISIHKDLESLYTNVPRDCLPDEYGGYSETLESCLKTHDDIIEDLSEFFEKISRLASYDDER